MGLQQSKEELLYQQVSRGNTEGIKELHTKGAGLEWIDKNGKTPLIVSCMNPELLSPARILIELGANLNAYRPGRNGGTPLHHAAKRGLEDTVKLLLSHGANALLINDDCQTPLGVARAKGFTNVVRTIESHVCLYSGWLREFYGPSFLGTFAPQLVSKKVWVVVYPCGTSTPTKPLKLELAIYHTLLDAKPHTVIALWNANMDEPNFHQPDPLAIITDHSRTSRGRRRCKRNIDIYRDTRRKGRVIRQTRVRLAPSSESEKHQLQLFCNACKGSLPAPLTSSACVPQSESNPSTTSSTPSAPPLEGPIHYPSIDSTPIVSPVLGENLGGLEKGDATCVICLDGAIEGACVPCGHMAGCMSCLNEVQAKKWGCPVCRAEIQQLIRLYAV